VGPIGLLKQQTPLFGQFSEVKAKHVCHGKDRRWFGGRQGAFDFIDWHMLSD